LFASFPTNAPRNVVAMQADIGFDPASLSSGTPLPGVAVSNQVLASSQPASQRRAPCSDLLFDQHALCLLLAFFEHRRNLGLAGAKLVGIAEQVSRQARVPWVTMFENYRVGY